VFNRVDNNGHTISDKNDRMRSVRACRAITERHGLYIAGGKENVNRQQLRDLDSVKYAIYDAIKAALPNCKSWGDLERKLSREGIAVTFKYGGGTATKQGIIFGKDGQSFNGSKIDRAFSFSKIDAVLNANAQRQESRNAPSFAPSPQPEHHQHSVPSHNHNSGDIISAMGDVFGAFNFEPSPGEDDNAPMPKKKKKKQQQYKPSF
jgi:hypothetical protein